MANIQIPERYSHDKLRDRLQYLESVSLLIEEAIAKEDNKAVVRLWNEHKKACKEFRHAFEEHDVEMQFVDELVEDKKQKDRIINQMHEKDAANDRRRKRLNEIKTWIAIITGLVTLMGWVGFQIVMN